MPQNPPIPKAGDFITTEDIEKMFEAIEMRQKNFPNEPRIISATLVAMNIGNRYRQVYCQEQEWSGVITDVQMPDKGQDPKCPNGHLLIKGPSLRLAWVESQ